MPKVLVAVVGMTKFVKPGSMGDYPDFAPIAIKRAIADARVSYSQIDQVFCGYVYGDSTCGQRVVYQIGLSGVPIVNVNNNCSTGSSALYLGRQAILSGEADCVLVVGFEKMAKGPTPLNGFH
jgi:sterol carrier protein 2